MKSLVGKRFDNIRPEGIAEHYVGSWHRIRLGEKVKLGRKVLGYAVEFVGMPDMSRYGYFGISLNTITEKELVKHFKEVK